MGSTTPWIAEVGRELADGSIDSTTLRTLAARIADALKGAAQRGEPEPVELRHLLRYIALSGTPAGVAAQAELDRCPAA